MVDLERDFEKGDEIAGDATIKPLVPRPSEPKLPAAPVLPLVAVCTPSEAVDLFGLLVLPAADIMIEVDGCYTMRCDTTRYDTFDENNEILDARWCSVLLDAAMRRLLSTFVFNFPYPNVRQRTRTRRREKLRPKLPSRSHLEHL